MTGWPARWRAEPVAGVFFWAMIFSYVWVAPSVYRYATQGYADFSAFYTAGKMVEAGASGRLYDLPAQTEVQRQFSRAAVLRNRALPYMRPPFEAALFVPLVRLSYPRAYLVWVVCNGLMVWAAAVLVRSRLPGLDRIARWVYYAAFFAFCPVAYGLALGQDSGVVLLLFAVMTVCFVAGHDFRAGCALGLALIKFHLVLPVVFVLLLKRRLRALAGFALVGALLVGAGALAVGLGGLVRYPLYLWRLNQIPAAAAIFPGMMPNLRGLLEGWGSPMQSYPVLDGVTAAVSVILLLWVARQWDAGRPGSKTYGGGLALVLAGAVLAGYHTFVYDLSLLCPLLLVSLIAGQDSELHAGTRRLLRGAAAALLCAPLYLIAMQLVGRLNGMGIFLVVLAVAWGRAVREWRTAMPAASSQASAAG